jgi:hypothetical protein
MNSSKIRLIRKTSRHCRKERPMPHRNQRKTGSSYEVKVRDHLATHWAAFFNGWSIINLENGEVLLCNTHADQAELHGVLNKIRDLNLILLSVKMIRDEA